LLAAIGGVGLSLAAGWRARERPAGADFGDLFALWLIGLASFLLAFVRYAHLPADPWRRLQNWASRNRIELAGLTALMLLALFVRAYDLEHIPANLGGDEGTWAMEGLAMLDGGLANPFGTRWFAFPSMSFLVWGLSTRVFGDTVGGVRAISALIGTASVLFAYLLARELWSRRVAWLAAIILAFGHYHIHFSRLAVNNIADSLFITLALYLLVRGLRSSRSIWFALSGSVIGAGWYGYFGARLVGVIAALYLAWRMAAEEEFLARHRRHVLGMVAGALVVTAPLLLNYAANPSVLTEGFDRVSIFASGWLGREQEITERSAFSLLLQQVCKSVSAFHYTLDPTFWYRARIPLVDSVSGILLVFGLIWCTAHHSWPSNGLLLIWFWLALSTGWMITENPPSSQRMVIVTPALAILVALGLDRLLWLEREVLDSRRAVRLVLAGILLAAMVSLNLGYYFFYYTPTRVYGNPTAEMTTRLARYLLHQEDDYVVYLHGPPFVYWDFGTLRFMARGISGVDVPPLGEGPTPEPDLSRGARFVFHPARVDELATIRARYPGGTERHFQSSAGSEPLFATYEIER
jgi:4-amino-4-deoxy-L-arabinose transferase-like glycosyltransferase